MKYLKHKDYVEAEKPKKVVPDVKDKIRAFVGEGKKSYEEIVKHIQNVEGVNITNDDVITQCEALQLETEFTKVVKDVEINFK